MVKEQINIQITEFLNRILPNLRSDVTQQIIEKFHQFYVFTTGDFILLEGCPEKIDEICSPCTEIILFRKLFGEITKIINDQKKVHDMSLVDGIEISVSPVENINSSGDANIAVIIDVANSLMRTPVDLCCIIDTSGSMGEHATSQDPNDETKNITYAINVLDLVKHAVKTIIHTLTQRDRLSIVEFNSNATTAFSLTEMDESGKMEAIKALEKLEPRFSTNIWDGLYAGLESLRKKSKYKYPTQVFCFAINRWTAH